MVKVSRSLDFGNPGGCVLSLDYELLWGVYGSHTKETYGANILGVREAIPRLLELFERYKAGCSWATVGFLFYDNREELLASFPSIKPTFQNRRNCNYTFIDNIGADEKSDPYHFGFSLLRRIAETPQQEIATHTYSHYYCLEEQCDQAAFAADMDAAVTSAKRLGVTLESIVYPRNQVCPTTFDICRERGITVYRGAGRHWFDQPSARESESLGRRISRLSYSYLPLGRSGVVDVNHHDGMTDVPASRFLRPYSRRFPKATALQLEAVKRDMRRAAREGRIFHLWAHPHNFGVNVNENMDLWEAVLVEFAALRDQYGWPSLTMAEAAKASVQL